jgi:hypothetical protein
MKETGIARKRRNGRFGRGARTCASFLGAPGKAARESLVAHLRHGQTRLTPTWSRTTSAPPPSGRRTGSSSAIPTPASTPRSSNRSSSPAFRSRSLHPRPADTSAHDEQQGRSRRPPRAGRRPRRSPRRRRPRLRRSRCRSSHQLGHHYDTARVVTAHQSYGGLVACSSQLCPSSSAKVAGWFGDWRD